MHAVRGLTGAASEGPSENMMRGNGHIAQGVDEHGPVAHGVLRAVSVPQGCMQGQHEAHACERRPGPIQNVGLDQYKVGERT